MIVINIILIVIFLYLSSSVVYVFIFSIAGRLGKLKKVPTTSILKKYAVLIPSYKEDQVIIESAKQALLQTYDKEKYDVIVVADSLKPQTIQTLRALPIQVVEVSFDISTKAKSLNKALEVLPEEYNYALILDADNIMANDFIEKINASFIYTGGKVIQGHRVAKNVNTKFAILDAISEEINNHVFRKGHRILGLSSALIGSGMAFEYKYFKKLLASSTAVGGFDRELELRLLKEGENMEYVEDAFVYDEKVENAEVFQNQRKRWMSAQLHYFRQYFIQGIWHLITRGNIDFFDKVYQQFLLPRVLLLASLFLLTGITSIVWFVFSVLIIPGVNMWMALTFIYLLGLIIAVPDKFYNKRTLNAALSIPKAILVMFLTLFKLKGANKKFIHTPHSGNHNVKS